MSAFDGLARLFLGLAGAFSRRPASKAASAPKAAQGAPERAPVPIPHAPAPEHESAPLPPAPRPASTIKPKHAAGVAGMAGVIAIATPLVTNFEGERTKAYRDVVGIPTVCIGETKNVHMGDVHTHAECQAMLAGRLQEFAQGVFSCVTVPMSSNRAAASISLAYNIGVPAFCRSAFVKALNAGEPDACDRMLAWDHAGGREVEGLKRRREAERKLCKS